jgi:hypothetical protein
MDELDDESDPTGALRHWRRLAADTAEAVAHERPTAELIERIAVRPRRSAPTDWQWRPGAACGSPGTRQPGRHATRGAMTRDEAGRLSWDELERLGYCECGQPLDGHPRPDRRARPVRLPPPWSPFRASAVQKAGMTHQEGRGPSS